MRSDVLWRAKKHLLRLCLVLVRIQQALISSRKALIYEDTLLLIELQEIEELKQICDEKESSFKTATKRNTDFIDFHPPLVVCSAANDHPY